MKKYFTLEEVKKLPSDVMNLGMNLRQDQLNGYSHKSGNEVLGDFFKELSFDELQDKEVGYSNVHIDIAGKQLQISNRPYPTVEESEQGIFWVSNIEKFGCVEIKYRKK